MFCLIIVVAALVPARYILAILGSVGMAIVYGLKVNLSVAMVAMLDHTAISRHQSLPSNALHPIHHNITLPANLNAEPECQGSTSSDTIEVCTIYKHFHIPFFILIF